MSRQLHPRCLHLQRWSCAAVGLTLCCSSRPDVCAAAYGTLTQLANCSSHPTRSTATGIAWTIRYANKDLSYWLNVNVYVFEAVPTNSLTSGANLAIEKRCNLSLSFSPTSQRLLIFRTMSGHHDRFWQCTPADGIGSYPRSISLRIFITKHLTGYYRSTI